MNFIIASLIFLAAAALIVAAKWFGVRDALSTYRRPGEPGSRARFSLATMLVAAIGIAIGLGAFVLLLRRG